MTVFLPMGETQWWAGEVTETALTFAEGDDDKLAAAAFARLLRQHDIAFEWSQLDGAHFLVGNGKWWPVRVKGVRTNDTLVPLDAFDEATPWVAYVNLAIEGIAVFMGLTYRTEREVEPRQLLSFGEWATAFHGPYALPEAA